MGSNREDANNTAVSGGRQGTLLVVQFMYPLPSLPPSFPPSLSHLLLHPPPLPSVGVPERGPHAKSSHRLIQIPRAKATDQRAGGREGGRGGGLDHVQEGVGEPGRGGREEGKEGGEV
jgi:hypothetical protein